VGSKTRSAGRELFNRPNLMGGALDLTFTARGIRLTDEMKAMAEHKLRRIEHLEPKAVRLDLELIAGANDHAASTRVEASLKVPRKTFLAHGDAPRLEDALDRLVERLERQVRDHHGRRRSRLASRIGLESASARPVSADNPEEPGRRGDG
jgi:ribosomal subunit interface protein